MLGFSLVTVVIGSNIRSLEDIGSTRESEGKLQKDEEILGGNILAYTPPSVIFCLLLWKIENVFFQNFGTGDGPCLKL